MAHLSDKTSHFSRTSSGSFRKRTNMVGTSWLCVTLYWLTSRREFLGVEMLHDHRSAAQPHDVMLSGSGAA